jgi:hypothetical protein
MMEPGVTGAWSVRDTLAHVTSWEEEALKHLPLILKGGTSHSPGRNPLKSNTRIRATGAGRRTRRCRDHHR